MVCLSLEQARIADSRHLRGCDNPGVPCNFKRKVSAVVRAGLVDVTDTLILADRSTEAFHHLSTTMGHRKTH